MMHSYAAEIDTRGRIRLLEPVHLPGPCRAVVTVLEPLPNTTGDQDDQAMLHVTESVLARDWNRHEEEEAWAHLQPDR
jgi:hypothetical protein